MTVMPMFPLGSVLMPAMPLPLRIFEPRYLKLLGDLMGSENPEFGVVLIERGDEVGGGEQRMTLGTIASVINIGTTQEFYGLESFGTQRFRVTSWLPDDPYPLAVIELVPDLVWDNTLLDSKNQLETKVRQLLAFASEFTNLQFGASTELSDDPMEACWQLAGILPIGELDQMDLLSSASAEELISRTFEIVTTADQTLRDIMAQQGEWKNPTFNDS
ncbi:MAG: LON peptidase substrate-binding domain-containing protein [Candidatus Nanopelagicales bacterium]|nr:LON peptidase substrate-binding domain-containing protein [Candidatus Nanopelagicales bacterium]